MTEPEPPPAEQEPRPAPVGRPLWSLLLAGLAGLAVGAMAVGASWLVAGTAGRGVDKRPIALPARIGKYLPVEQIDLNKQPVAHLAMDNERRRNTESTKLLSESHGGAGALYAHYSDQELETQLIVMIYRDRSANPLFLPYVDADDLGLDQPQQSVERFGEVSCIVVNDPVPKGQTPKHPPSAAKCARSGETLTVEIGAVGGSDTAKDPAEMAKLVDEVWAAVSQPGV